MTTMKDVAEKAGVSVATVSRVINDTGFVSDELRERVHEVMTELKYRPSNVARSLRRQQTRTVAVVVPQLDQPFFSTLTFAIQQRLFEEDYYTFTCSTMESEDEEAAYIEMLLGQRVDGVIVAPTGHSSENIRLLLQADVPVVLVDRDLPEIEHIDRVLFDNVTGGVLGVEHLTELGHRQITIIGGPSYSSAIKQRIVGIRRTLAQHDIEPHVLTYDDMTPFDIGYTGATEVLNTPKRPTAIFALTDTAAVGVMHAARKRGLSLPDDLSVMGFDDIPLATYSLPALTSIAQPIHGIGKQTAELLLARLQDPERPPVTRISEAQLVVRDSTQPPDEDK